MRSVTLPFLCLAATTLASAANPSITIRDVKLGEHWFGPQYNSKDLEGRVVLYEIWGYN